MPYTSICTAIQDDGKVHEVKSRNKTTCGKDINAIKRIGTGGEEISLDKACLICFPFLKKEMQK